MAGLLASAVLRAGYPLGFLVVPLLVYDGWKEDYRGMFAALRDLVPEAAKDPGLTFEFVSHRFTPRAKRRIQSIFPHTVVPMDEAERKFKYGQFGYGKYVYPPDVLAEMKELMLSLVKEHFPRARVEYFV